MPPHKPHAPRNDCKLTQELVDKFIACLDDGTPPFFALAADRAGLRRGQVKSWINSADHDPNPHPLILQLARKAREVKANYVLRCMEQMISCDAKTAARAGQLQWLVTRLERDELHINPNPGKEVARPAEAKPQPAQPESFDSAGVQKAADDLADPPAVH